MSNDANPNNPNNPEDVNSDNFENPDDEFSGFFDRFDNADVFDKFRNETKNAELRAKREREEAIRKEAAALQEELRLKAEAEQRQLQYEAEEDARMQAEEEAEYDAANEPTGAKLRGRASGRIPDTWVTSADIDMLNAESRQIKEGETDEELARRIMRANLPSVAMGLAKMALYDTNANVRLRASQYLMDRVLGKPGEDVNVGVQSPLEQLMGEITEVLNR